MTDSELVEKVLKAGGPPMKRNAFFCVISTRVELGQSISQGQRLWLQETLRRARKVIVVDPAPKELPS